jgi:hypothetical protein
MEKIMGKTKLGGIFKMECWRPFDADLTSEIRLKYGIDSPEYKALPRFKVWEDQAHNLVTNEGLNKLLDVMLHGATQITPWYCVISETNTTPAAGMTYASPSFTETTAYDEATRPEYNEAAASSQSITNLANKAQFTVNATKTLYGAGLVGGGSAPSTKGNTAGGGALLCYALFASSRSVADDDIVNLTYTISAADDGA